MVRADQRTGTGTGGCSFIAVTDGTDPGERTARRAAEEGLVSLFGKELDVAIAMLSTHSLRVGLTQDLFAAGEDAGPIAWALRWTSTATALRYGRKLAPEANATARMLGKVRG